MSKDVAISFSNFLTLYKEGALSFHLELHEQTKQELFGKENTFSMKKKKNLKSETTEYPRRRHKDFIQAISKLI